ncbi:MAG TPA: sialidase family protein [Thermoanaerobaculia bacterium]|nr:sialidase family protein [Thermoanaerobaculia bacterium]
MRRIVFALIAVAILGCAGEKVSDGGKPAPPARTATTQASVVQELPSPAGAGAAEPFLAVTRDGVLLSWLEPVANTDRVALRFARYGSGQWSAPRTIVERNDLFVNWADFPSIVEDAKGALFAHWLQKSGKGTYSYDVQMAASPDGGATWGKPFLLNRDGKEAEHGFVTLAALPDGGVGATWLDGRKMTGGDHAGHDMGGDMGIRYATVSANGTIAEDVELDDRTCECCTTGMTMTSSGPVIVYRDRSPEEVRDIAYVTKTANGWTKPARVNADDWKIDACPVNGPQADAIGKRVVTAWFTAAQEKGRAYVAFSDDGGVTFAKPVQIDDGKPIGRLDVLLLDEEIALVTWLEQTQAGGEIRARRVTRAGKAEPAMKIADSSTARAAGFARTARIERDVYFAWTEQTANSKRVHIARGRF